MDSAVAGLALGPYEQLLKFGISGSIHLMATLGCTMLLGLPPGHVCDPVACVCLSLASLLLLSHKPCHKTKGTDAIKITSSNNTNSNEGADGDQMLTPTASTARTRLDLSVMISYCWADSDFVRCSIIRHGVSLEDAFSTHGVV
jgi:hypothetical protein